MALFDERVMRPADEALPVRRERDLVRHTEPRQRANLPHQPHHRQLSTQGLPPPVWQERTLAGHGRSVTLVRPTLIPYTRKVDVRLPGKGN